jgi:hypothetical protein
MKDTTTRMNLINMTAAGGLAVLGGFWLIISPYILDYGNSNIVNVQNATLLGIICGSVAIGLGLFAIVTERLAQFENFRLAAAGLLVGLGVLLMAAPYLFNYSIYREPLWNLQITGGIFALIAGFVLQALYYARKSPAAEITA